MYITSLLIEIIFLNLCMPVYSTQFLSRLLLCVIICISTTYYNFSTDLQFVISTTYYNFFDVFTIFISTTYILRTYYNLYINDVLRTYYNLVYQRRITFFPDVFTIFISTMYYERCNLRKWTTVEKDVNFKFNIKNR